MNKFFNILFTGLLLAFCGSIQAQNKDIDKGKETLRRAFQTKEMAKRTELIQEATALFTKGGMGKEANALIGDAYLKQGDLTQAVNYYNRCDKEDKAIGQEKAAEAYVDQAFEDPKNEAKFIKNATSLYTKAGKLAEGSVLIGDRYFEMGDKYYDKALEYYFIGQDTASVEKVANTYIAKGGEDALKSVDILKKIGSKSALKKAGDLCYDMNQYDRAYDCYSIAGLSEGLRKTADKYNELGKGNEAANVYIKLAESYMKTANTEAVERLANENVRAMNYGLASKIFDKAGNVTLSKKYLSYYKFMEMEFEEAKMLMENTEDAPLIKAIDVNMKYLDVLKSINSSLAEYKKNQPFVRTEVDSKTGKYIPAPKDEYILIDYYKNLKEPIVDFFLDVSRNLTPINSAPLKQMMMKKFLEYPAAIKILDAETFAPKLTQTTSGVKDVYLK